MSVRRLLVARAFCMAGLGLVMFAAGQSIPITAQGPAVAGSVEPLPSFSEPAISPDRGEIAVVSGGDVWTVSAAGGDARLLVSHEATESRPLYAPDGDRLAFVSDRTGGGDIYVLSLKTGALKQITFDDGAERLDAWSGTASGCIFRRRAATSLG